jgi:hypothetical protein
MRLCLMGSTQRTNNAAVAVGPAASQATASSRAGQAILVAGRAQMSQRSRELIPPKPFVRW